MQGAEPISLPKTSLSVTKNVLAAILVERRLKPASPMPVLVFSPEAKISRLGDRLSLSPVSDMLPADSVVRYGADVTTWLRRRR